jgi:hypothetical protein
MCDDEHYDRDRRRRTEHGLRRAQNAGTAEQRIDEFVTRCHQAADGKCGGKDDADHGLGSSPCPLFERPHQQRAEEQHGHGTDERMDVKGEGDTNPGQRHVRQRIGGKRHPPHDREAPDQAGRDGHRNREQ